LAGNINESLLHGAWLHSHEEDMPDQMVFRPASMQLPPARGRSGYTFEPDGQVVTIGSSPVDRTSTVKGRWSVDNNGQITIELPGREKEVLQVVQQDKDRLVMKAR